MKFLLNEECNLLKKIIKECDNMINHITLIDFNFEIKQFADTKFPKFELPKPFVYEQYSPYLYLRERNKNDSDGKNEEIYKVIINNLNHLFFSDKSSEKNNYKINIEDMDYICNLVHEILDSKKLDFNKINNLLNIKKLRVLFLREINQYRKEGIFTLNNISYDNMARIFNIIIDISIKEKDYESIKSCMILSETFYKKLDNKILLQKELIKNEIWKNIKFWEEFIEYSIKEDINYSKGYLIFLEENEEKREERVKNCINSVLITFSYNMTLFNVPKNDKKQIMNSFMKKYEIEDNIMINSEIEINEIQDEIIYQSVGNNLDINPNNE